MRNQADLILLSHKLTAELRRVAAATEDRELAIQLGRMADEEDALVAGLENATKVTLAFERHEAI